MFSDVAQAVLDLAARAALFSQPIALASELKPENLLHRTMAAFALLATVSEALVVGPGLAPGHAVQVHRASLPRRRALRVGRQAVSLRSGFL